MDPGSVAALSNLTDDITAIVIVMFAVTGLAWVVGQYIKYRSAGKSRPEELAALDRMSQTAQRLERRVAALERVLDAEAPAWRNTLHDEGGRYEHTG